LHLEWLNWALICEETVTGLHPATHPPPVVAVTLLTPPLTHPLPPNMRIKYNRLCVNKITIVCT
jgi:hypothetical protein